MPLYIFKYFLKYAYRNNVFFEKPALNNNKINFYVYILPTTTAFYKKHNFAQTIYND